MKRVTVLNKLKKSGVIAVLRAHTKEEALKATEAIINGGITGIEVTFSVPQAEEVVRKIKEIHSGCEELVIGAGTVLDAITARMAILAGAEYIVSPAFDKETAEVCNLYQVPYLPGCMTITEISTALKAGVDIIKLFPGSSYNPSFINAVKGPLPQVNIMPTGGVNIENMHQWFEYGCVAIGVGGDLLAPAQNGDYAKVSELAREYVDKLAEIRKGA